MRLYGQLWLSSSELIHGRIGKLTSSANRTLVPIHCQVAADLVSSMAPFLNRADTIE